MSHATATAHRLSRSLIGALRPGGGIFLEEEMARGPAAEYFRQQRLTRMLSDGRRNTESARWNRKAERATIIITCVLAAICVAMAAIGI